MGTVHNNNNLNYTLKKASVANIKAFKDTGLGALMSGSRKAGVRSARSLRSIDRFIVEVLLLAHSHTFLKYGTQ